MGLATHGTPRSPPADPPSPQPALTWRPRSLAGGRRGRTAVPGGCCCRGASPDTAAAATTAAGSKPGGLGGADLRPRRRGGRGWAASRSAALRGERGEEGGKGGALQRVGGLRDSPGRPEVAGRVLRVLVSLMGSPPPHTPVVGDGDGDGGGTGRGSGWRQPGWGGVGKGGRGWPPVPRFLLWGLLSREGGFGVLSSLPGRCAWRRARGLRVLPQLHSWSRCC